MLQDHHIVITTAFSLTGNFPSFPWFCLVIFSGNAECKFVDNGISYLRMPNRNAVLTPYKELRCSGKNIREIFSL